MHAAKVAPYKAFFFLSQSIKFKLSKKIISHVTLVCKRRKQKQDVLSQSRRPAHAEVRLRCRRQKIFPQSSKVLQNNSKH